MPADRSSDQRRGAAVGHQADLGEGKHEKRFVRSQYDIAGQGQGNPDAGRRSLDDRHDRMRQRGDRADQPVDLER